MKDACDNCGRVAELYHNESAGLAFCEACDAAQDALDEAARAIEVPAHVNEIATREVAGLKVELAYLPLMDMTVIACTVGGTVMSHTIPHEKAFDAFHHPMLYLSKAQVAELGIR
jgi:hypothetical protein